MVNRGERGVKRTIADFQNRVGVIWKTTKKYEGNIKKYERKMKKYVETMKKYLWRNYEKIWRKKWRNIKGNIKKYERNMMKHFPEFPEYVKGNPMRREGPMGPDSKILFLRLLGKPIWGKGLMCPYPNIPFLRLGERTFSSGADIFLNRWRGTRSKEKILWVPIQKDLSVGLDLPGGKSSQI